MHHRSCSPAGRTFCAPCCAFCCHLCSLLPPLSLRAAVFRHSLKAPNEAKPRAGIELHPACRLTPASLRAAALLLRCRVWEASAEIYRTALAVLQQARQHHGLGGYLEARL